MHIQKYYIVPDRVLDLDRLLQLRFKYSACDFVDNSAY